MAQEKAERHHDAQPARAGFLRKHFCAVAPDNPDGKRNHQPCIAEILIGTPPLGFEPVEHTQTAAVHFGIASEKVVQGKRHRNPCRATYGAYGIGALPIGKQGGKGRHSIVTRANFRATDAAQMELLPFYWKAAYPARQGAAQVYPGFLSHTEEGCETQPRDELR